MEDIESPYLEDFQELEVSFSRVQDARDEEHWDDEREFMQDVVNELRQLLRGKGRCTRVNVMHQFCQYLTAHADYIEDELADEMLTLAGFPGARAEMQAATLDQATPAGPGKSTTPRL